MLIRKLFPDEFSSDVDISFSAGGYISDESESSMTTTDSSFKSDSSNSATNKVSQTGGDCGCEKEKEKEKR